MLRKTYFVLFDIILNKLCVHRNSQLKNGFFLHSYQIQFYVHFEISVNQMVKIIVLQHNFFSQCQVKTTMR